MSPEIPVRDELGNLDKLKGSIEREGILQPIGVKPIDEEWRKFEIAIGLRRYTACKELGKRKIPAYIGDFGGEELSAVALEENRKRKNLNHREILRAMLDLKRKAYTLERIAEISGMDAAKVSVYLRIPELPDEVKKSFFFRRHNILTFESFGES